MNGFINPIFIRGNVFYNIHHNGIGINILNGMDGTATVKINDNSFYCLEKTQCAISFSNEKNTLDPNNDCMKSDSNSYYFVANDGNFYRKLSQNQKTKATENVPAWKSDGNDKHGYFFLKNKFDSLAPKPDPKNPLDTASISEHFPIFVNNSAQPKSFQLKSHGYKHVDGSDIPETITVPPYSAIILRDDHPPIGNAKAIRGRG